MSSLRIGASSWSAPSWEGVFYPKGTLPAEYLPFYAAEFDTVEVDATFYRTPSSRMVDAWRERTPPGFLFAAKVPQVITHEKLLADCAAEMNEFVTTMDRLGDKLGPLLFQFRYFKESELPEPDPFLDRLERFLPSLPDGHRFAVEVRNKSLITRRLLDILSKHRIALALIDHPWFYRIDTMMMKTGVLTADFVYLRWLGDRYKIEEQTKRWDRIIIDRSREMEHWIAAIRKMLEQERSVYGYFNNHYAGYAVGSLRYFRDLWQQESSS
ncbi:MAG TPA: DUF72 domain-containing protein [Candidatus Polarisedimenticolia bacterium]|nr:DUF72 domain-containing protein [Candidatus Polarisedimenticolia bacterium]